MRLVSCSNSDWGKPFIRTRPLFFSVTPYEYFVSALKGTKFSDFYECFKCIFGSPFVLICTTNASCQILAYSALIINRHIEAVHSERKHHHINNHCACKRFYINTFSCDNFWKESVIALLSDNQ